MKNPNGKGKLWEKQRRDRLKESFYKLAQLLPHYDPAKLPPQNEILEKATQFVKELRTSNSRLLLQQTQTDEKTKLIQELQDEVNRLILRVKQLTTLLTQAKITIPTGPTITSLGKRKLKWSDRFPMPAESSSAKKQKTAEQQSKLTQKAIKSTITTFGVTNPGSNSSTCSEGSNSEKENESPRPVLAENSPTPSPAANVNNSKSKTSSASSPSVNSNNGKVTRIPSPVASVNNVKTKLPPPTSSRTSASTTAPPVIQVTSASTSLPQIQIPMTFTLPVQTTPATTTFILTPHSLTPVHAPIVTRITLPNLQPSARILPKPTHSTKLPLVRITKTIPKYKKTRNRKKKSAPLPIRVDAAQIPDKSSSNHESNSEPTEDPTNGAVQQHINAELESSIHRNDPSTQESKQLVEETVEHPVIRIPSPVPQTEGEADPVDKTTAKNIIVLALAETIDTEIPADKPDCVTVVQSDGSLQSEKDSNIESESAIPSQTSTSETVACEIFNEKVQEYEIPVDSETSPTSKVGKASNKQSEVDKENNVSIVEQKSVPVDENQSKRSNSDSCALIENENITPSAIIPKESTEKDKTMHKANLQKIIPPPVSKMPGNLLEQDHLVSESSFQDIAELISEQQITSNSSSVSTLLPPPSGSLALPSPRDEVEDIPVSKASAISPIPPPEESLPTDKISECIARSIDLIDQPEAELMELGADWTHSPKSPISPTQMFLSMFPLLPRESILAQETPVHTPQKPLQPQTGFSTNKSSFYIDSMLPDEHSTSSNDAFRGSSATATVLSNNLNISNLVPSSFDSLASTNHCLQQSTCSFSLSLLGDTFDNSNPFNFNLVPPSVPSTSIVVPKSAVPTSSITSFSVEQSIPPKSQTSQSSVAITSTSSSITTVFSSSQTSRSEVDFSVFSPYNFINSATNHVPSQNYCVTGTPAISTPQKDNTWTPFNYNVITPVKTPGSNSTFNPVSQISSDHNKIFRPIVDYGTEFSAPVVALNAKELSSINDSNTDSSLSNQRPGNNANVTEPCSTNANKIGDNTRCKSYPNPKTISTSNTNDNCSQQIHPQQLVLQPRSNNYQEQTTGSVLSVSSHSETSQNANYQQLFRPMASIGSTSHRNSFQETRTNCDTSSQRKGTGASNRGSNSGNQSSKYGNHAISNSSGNSTSNQVASSVKNNGCNQVPAIISSPSTKKKGKNTPKSQQSPVRSNKQDQSNNSSCHTQKTSRSQPGSATKNNDSLTTYSLYNPPHFQLFPPADAACSMVHPLPPSTAPHLSTSHLIPSVHPSTCSSSLLFPPTLALNTQEVAGHSQSTSRSNCRKSREQNQSSQPDMSKKKSSSNSNQTPENSQHISQQTPLRSSVQASACTGHVQHQQSTHQPNLPQQPSPQHSSQQPRNLQQHHEIQYPQTSSLHSQTISHQQPAAPNLHHSLPTPTHQSQPSLQQLSQNHQLNQHQQQQSFMDFGSFNNFYDTLLPQPPLSQSTNQFLTHQSQTSDISRNQRQPFYLPDVAPLQNLELVAPHHQQYNSVATVVPQHQSQDSPQMNVNSNPQKSTSSSATKHTYFNQYNYGSLVETPVFGSSGNNNIGENNQSQSQNHTQPSHQHAPRQSGSKNKPAASHHVAYANQHQPRSNSQTQSQSNSHNQNQQTLSNRQQPQPQMQSNMAHQSQNQHLVRNNTHNNNTQSPQNINSQSNTHSHSNNLHTARNGSQQQQSQPSGQQQPSNQPQTHSSQRSHQHTSNNNTNLQPSRPWQNDAPSTCPRTTKSDVIPNPFSVSKLVGNVSSNNQNSGSNNISTNTNYCVEGLIRKNAWNNASNNSSTNFHFSGNNTPNSHNVAGISQQHFVPYQPMISEPEIHHHQYHYGNYQNFQNQNYPTSHFGNFDVTGSNQPGNTGILNQPLPHTRQQHGSSNAINSAQGNAPFEMSSTSHHSHQSTQQHQAGSSVLNFNLSSIFPEMNDKRSGGGNSGGGNSSNNNNCNNNNSYYNAPGSTNANSKARK